jgi:hypothetical protein
MSHVMAWRALNISATSVETTTSESHAVILGDTITKVGVGGNKQYGSLSNLTSQTALSATELSIINKPLNYPNPFQLSRGTTIGYKLTQDSDVRLEIYNSFGHRILRKDIMAGASGGSAFQYNRITLTKSDFKYDLPAGVYFYVLTANGEKIGKGKMAIIP